MSEFTNKSVTDLTKLVIEKRESLRAARFGSAGAKSKNVREARAIRKDIARMLTSLRERHHK